MIDDIIEMAKLDGMDQSVCLFGVIGGQILTADSVVRYNGDLPLITGL